MVVEYTDRCRKCGDIGIFVKKWKLCQRCYAAFMKENRNKIINDTKITYYSELDFIKNFFKHNEWVYHPAAFRLNGTTYEPDFYDRKRDMFIEVSASSGAFYANKEKYEEMKKIFPKINFEIRAVNGDLIDLDAERQHIQSFSENKS